MKYIFTFLSILVFLENGISQKAPLKYGHLEEQEINLSEFNQSSAVILCDYGRYYFDARIGRVFFYFTRHVRIKILTEEGLKYATQTFSFYDLTKATYYSNSKGYELRGQTLNIAEGGKVIKTKLKGKNSLESAISKEFISTITIKFPEVKVGSVIEYELSIPTIEIVNPPIWFMQYEIPVIHSELRITSPEEISYGARSYNCDYFDISEQKSEGSTMSYPKGSISYPANKYQFVKKNIPAYSPIDSASINTRMYIKFMLERATRKFVMPGMEELFKATDPSFKYLDKAEKNNTLRNVGYVLYYKPELEKLALDLMKDPSFGPPLVINLGLNDTLKKITAHTTNASEKVKLIHNYVSSHITWDSTYRVFVNNGFSLRTAEFLSRFSSGNLQLNTSLSKPLKKHTGSSSEINFIFINLLNTAGIKAYPILVSTQKNELIDTSFFNLHQFNHVLAYVQIDGKEYILDAVKKGNGSILTEDALNPFGLLIEKNNTFWVNLSVAKN